MEFLMRAFRFFIAASVLFSLIFVGCSRTIKYRGHAGIEPPQDMGWKYYRYDELNSGFVDRIVKTPLDQLWEFKTGAAVNAQMLADKTFILAGDLAGNLYLIDDYSGKRLGKMKFKGGFSAAPYLGDSILYFGTDIKASKAGAIDYYDGDILWKIPGRDFIGQIDYGWGMLYTGETDGRLTAWRADDGAEIWKKDLDGSIVTGCFLKDTIVYSGTEKGMLYAFDHRTGAEIFIKKTDATLQGHIASDGDALYICSFDSAIFKFNSNTGAVLWKLKTDGAFRCGVSIAGDTLYACSSNGKLYAIDCMTSEQYFEYDAGTPLIASPLATRDKVFIGTLGGVLYAIDRFTGMNISEYCAESPIVSSPILFKDIIIISCENRRLYALR